MKAKRGGDSRTSPLPGWIRQCSNGVALEIHLQPGARRTAIVGEHGQRLKVAVSAPPVEGRANAALIELLSDRLDIPRAALTVEAGALSRDKRLIAASVLPAEELVRRLLAPQK
jgi:hypothetical protein